MDNIFHLWYFLFIAIGMFLHIKGFRVQSFEKILHHFSHAKKNTLLIIFFLDAEVLPSGNRISATHFSVIFLFISKQMEQKQLLKEFPNGFFVDM